MVVLRALAAATAAAFLSAAAFGCSSGLSKEDADIRCDQDKVALGAVMTDEAYAQCESCYMECGDSCVRHSTTPISYSCEEASGSGGSSTTTTSQ